MRANLSRALASRSRAATTLLSASAALLLLRLWAAFHVGFGDSEALYASYAAHPQPAYLDHPGLVGVVGRWLGRGGPPTPVGAHLFTSLVATATPFVMALACRASGAGWVRAFGAATLVALAPEMAIGLFALTPDVLLAPAWLAALGLLALGLRSPPGTPRADLALLGGGLVAGVAAASKVTGVLLFASVVVSLLAPPNRRHARSFWPWLGLALGAAILAPEVFFEARSGWPMLRHRLVDTQTLAGFSLRNAFALAGGQLLYLSPVFALLCATALRDAWAERRNGVGALLATACLLPLAVLVPLCLWSPAAEPHWLAPAFLSLVPAAARAPASPPRRLVVAGAAVAAAMVLCVHAWVLLPWVSSLAPESFDVRIDISNELYGWPEVASAVLEETARARASRGATDDVFVVAPHWVLCAQLEARLSGRVGVGCDSPQEDDFDTWLPRARWRAAKLLVWVKDTRFGAPDMPRGFAIVSTREVVIRRGGRSIRRFSLSILSRSALALTRPARAPWRGGPRCAAARGLLRPPDWAWSAACPRRRSNWLLRTLPSAAPRD